MIQLLSLCVSRFGKRNRHITPRNSIGDRRLRAIGPVCCCAQWCSLSLQSDRAAARSAHTAQRGSTAEISIKIQIYREGFTRASANCNSSCQVVSAVEQKDRSTLGLGARVFTTTAIVSSKLKLKLKFKSQSTRSWSEWRATRTRCSKGFLPAQRDHGERHNVD